MSFLKKLFGDNKDLSLIVDHVEGIKVFDPEERINIIWKKEKRSLTFKSLIDKNKVEAELDLGKVEYIELTTEQEILEKDKSVIGRAVVGTVLAGPLGAIVGGMSGIGKKKKKGKERKIAIIGYDEREIILISNGFSIGIETFFKMLKDDVNDKNSIDGKVQL